MFHDLQGPTFKRIRLYARLSVEKLAKKVGKSRRTIERLEGNDQELMVNYELEQRIFEVTKVTKQIFGRIISGTLGDHLDRQVVILPRGSLVPTLDLLEAVELYADHANLLTAGDREFIRDMLTEIQTNYLGAEKLCMLLAKEIVRRVNEAREALDEDPSNDDED